MKAVTDGRNTAVGQRGKTLNSLDRIVRSVRVFSRELTRSPKELLPPRRVSLGIALGGGLFAPSHDRLQPVGRVIQGAAGRNGLDLRLARPGCD